MRSERRTVPTGNNKKIPRRLGITLHLLGMLRKFAYGSSKKKNKIVKITSLRLFIIAKVIYIKKLYGICWFKISLSCQKELNAVCCHQEPK